MLALTFLRDYARRPLNVVLLLVVPVIFVGLSAGVIVDFAAILGSLANLGSLEAATAGWAAAVLAGIGGFFQVVGSRDADRRLAAAGSGTLAVVTARIASGLALAGVATAGSLLALWWRAGIHDPGRTIATTAMFALIYLGIGAAVGAVVHDELNGSLIVLFVWMFDMFLGPGFSGGDNPLVRVFPTHFPTLVMLNLDTGHTSAAADLAYSALWAVGALSTAVILLTRSTRPLAPEHTGNRLGALAAIPGALLGGSGTLLRRSTSRSPRRRWRGPRAVTAFRYAVRQYRRNTAMWVLLLGLPVAFITLSFAVTPEQPAPVELVEGGHTTLSILSMVKVHGAIMAPITIAFLAGIAGLFVVLGSAQADRRLVGAGFHTSEVLAARFGVIWGVALAVTAVSVAVTAIDFTPQSWGLFIAANVLIALTYGMLGVIVGELAGRLGGLYLIITIPFIDVGIAQNVMFSAAPPAWGRFLPGHGAIRLLVDGAFTPSFDETGALLVALAWLAAATAAALIIFHRLARPVKG
jgi:hypothetical protein